MRLRTPKLRNWRRRGMALWQIEGASSRWLEALRLLAGSRGAGVVGVPKTLKR